MDKVVRKIAFFVLAICLPASVLAQSTQTDGISADEKKRLEERFKALKTYYIDDDGTVVYIPDKNNKSSNTKTVTGADTLADATTKANENESEASTQNNSFNALIGASEPILEEDVLRSNPEPEEVRPVFTRPVENTVVEEKIDDLFSEPVITKSKAETAVSVAKEKTGEENAIARGPKKATEVKYKTIEEASMAVDATLEMLKKQQTQSQMDEKKASLSRMITGGGGSVLRKTNSSYKLLDEIPDNAISNLTPEKENTTDYGDEPTYYINGVKVDRTEVEKLKQKDIIRKERKRSSTNPNGEEWIETR